MIGVPSIIGLLAPPPTTAPTEIRVTNPVLPIKPDTDTPTPIITSDTDTANAVTTPNTDTPTPTHTPTSTPTKEPPSPTFTPIPAIPADPADFIRFYFDNINNRNYELTWSLLSDAYKARTNPDGINTYINFWNGYSRVDITKVDYTRPSSTSALTTSEATFYKNNYSSNSKLSYYLIWDSSRNTWLFDPMHAIGSSTDTTCSAVPKRLSVGIQAKVVTATASLSVETNFN